MQGNGSASLFAGVFGGGLHDEVSGVVVSDRFERVGDFRCRVFGVGVVHIDAAAVGGDHVGDVELRGVGEHVRLAAARSRRVPRASLTGSSCR